MWARVFVRTGWATATVAAVVFGIIGALVMPVAMVITWSLLGLAIGVVAGKSLFSTSMLARPSMPRLIMRAEPDSWRAMVVGLGFFLTCLVITGLVTVTGPAAAAELLGCWLAVATMLRWRSRRLPSTTRQAAAPDPPAPTTAVVPAIAVDTLPIEELCLVWRRSYHQLQVATDEPTRRRLVRARQEYLDELERRDRPGFARWLDSGARPGSDPGRYLSHG